MNYDIRKLSNIPKKISQHPNSPKILYVSGKIDFPNTHYITIVGARKCTPYGISVCKKIISDLRGYPIVIVSGLALGIDAVAHKAALENDIPTIAIIGSGLDESVLYPRTNLILANNIVKKGGGLLSEFEPLTKAAPYTFPMRNRIMAAISDICLIVECEKLSGTLITAKIALEYNKEVCAVPGSIYSPLSVGSHMLIKEGANPITSGGDILEILDIDENDKQTVILSNVTENEKIVLGALIEPKSKEDLIDTLPMDIDKIQATISLLEIKGLIKEEYGLLRII